MRHTIWMTAAVSSALTLAGVRLLGQATATQAVKLENARVQVTETTTQPGGVRPVHIRLADQVIVFLDDCEYERRDAKAGKAERVRRKSGDVIWHRQGETANELANVGSRPYRTLTIALR